MKKWIAVLSSILLGPLAGLAVVAEEEMEESSSTSTTTTKTRGTTPVVCDALRHRAPRDVPWTTVLRQQQQQTFPSFDEFVVRYDKAYDTAAERARRHRIYDDRVREIQRYNAQRGPHDHVQGVNHLTDLLPEELFTGYQKPSARTTLENAASSPLRHVRTSNNAGTATDHRRRELRELTSLLGSPLLPVSELPATVDWRTQGVTTPVKNQGHCGSCWAFASTAVLESHVAISTCVLFGLSEQQLVSCAPNPHACGGTGGCLGSTAELAFAYAQTAGLVEEDAFGYQSFHGDAVNCTLATTNDDDDDSSESPASVQFVKDAVASIGGWVALPRNNYVAVMNAVARLGPLAVSVACLPWMSYQSGVYTGTLDPDDSSTTDVNHLVVLEGYGTDETTGQDYWLIRNSWGPLWGESGYIRLLRTSDPEEEGYCGMDVTPADGVACTKDDNGLPVNPPNEEICGNSGILFDVSLPYGASLIP